MYKNSLKISSFKTRIKGEYPLQKVKMFLHMSNKYFQRTKENVPYRYRTVPVETFRSGYWQKGLPRPTFFLLLRYFYCFKKRPIEI